MQNPNKCFQCASGHYENKTVDFPATLPGGADITIPTVPLWECDKCGDQVIPPESSRMIERYVAKQAG